MTHDEMIAVIEASKAGKEIEYRVIGGQGKWLPTQDLPVWNFSAYEYREKREPKPDILVKYRAESACAYAYSVGAVRVPPKPNLCLTFNGETGELKAAEVLK